MDGTRLIVLTATVRSFLNICIVNMADVENVDAPVASTPSVAPPMAERCRCGHFNEYHIDRIGACGLWVDMARRKGSKLDDDVSAAMCPCPQFRPRRKR